MPMLILVYFQTDAIQQIEDSIRSILGMQVPIGKLLATVFWRKEKLNSFPIAKLGLFEMQKLFRSLKTNSI